MCVYLVCSFSSPVFFLIRPLPRSTLFPYTTLFRSEYLHSTEVFGIWSLPDRSSPAKRWIEDKLDAAIALYKKEIEQRRWYGFWRSEEHTSELQSRFDLVCRLLLEKKNNVKMIATDD